MKQQFLIDPYIPREGIILLHGKTSVGKSPVTWEMARCISAGRPFFGSPTRKGKVLYIDVDTPKSAIQSRLHHLPRSQADEEGVWWLFGPSFDCTSPIDPVVRELKESRSVVEPDLVIVNTLQKVHTLDDVKSGTASIIYRAWQHLFPNRAIMFVHHNTKDYGEGSRPVSESYSGSMAFLNHIQSAMALYRVARPRGIAEYDERIFVTLEHTKCQVGATADKLILTLDEDHHTIVQAYSADRDTVIAEEWAKTDPTLSLRQRCAEVAQHVEWKRTTIMRVVTRLGLSRKDSD